MKKEEREVTFSKYVSVTVKSNLPSLLLFASMTLLFVFLCFLRSFYTMSWIELPPPSPYSTPNHLSGKGLVPISSPGRVERGTARVSPPKTRHNDPQTQTN